MSSSPQSLRLAVIGSGPAGVYAAETLLRSEAVKSGRLEVQADIFDRLPAPFGLIRYGVAPDSAHQGDHHRAAPHPGPR